LSQEAKELYQSKGESAIVVVNADNEIIRLGDEIVPDPEGQYTVSVQAEPAEGGSATVNGNSTATVDAGSTVTLTATPYSGDYKFDGWYLNDVQVSTSSTYTPTVTGNATYIAKFSKEGGVEPEPEQPAQTDGYYYVINRDTNRREYLYNNALHTGNSLYFTLQSDAAVSTNNGIWYIDFNDDKALGIKNGDGKPLVAGASWGGSIAGSYDVLTIKKVLYKHNIPLLNASEIARLARSQAVAQIDPKTDEIVCIFASIAEAEKATGNGKHIGSVCMGKRATTKGYKWKYVKDITY
jgi:uncharacterized repeat protein (TIGR02543 family)